MGHPLKRKGTKRLLARTRYKVDKRVREHNRKKRREAKKERKGGPKPDMVVAPNLCPFKADIISELNKAKEKEKELRMENIKLCSETNTEEIQSSLQEYVQDAQNRGQLFQAIDVDEVIERKLNDNERLENASLAKEFKKVVAAADIILEVVDARDPLGTRCKLVEETVLQSPGKRLVLVVNKADLVPREVLERWLTYLRGKWPAVPFKASVQQQAKRLGRKAMVKRSKHRKDLEKLMAASSCVGAEFLMRLLANYCRGKYAKTSITIGVVGMPNVGKSSLINSLKRAKSCRVGAEPGVTKTLQIVKIGAQMKILDSPGIVLDPPLAENRSLLCLKNLVRTDKLVDPKIAAEAILRRATKQQMMDLYHVEDYSTPDEFLLLYSKRFGLLGKRGIPDTFKAAKALVQDWNRGKIRYYTLPPEENIDTHVSAEIVTTATDEFDIQQFNKESDQLMDIIQTPEQISTYLHVTDNIDTDVEMKQVSNIVIDSTVQTKKSGKLRWRKKKKNQTDRDAFVPIPKQKKLQKLAAKKQRKERARMAKRMQSNSMEIE